MSSLGMSAGDLFGFVALFLIAASAVLMLFRSRVLKATRNIGLVRTLHVAVSASAGVFLSLHIAALFLPPTSTGILLGYAAVGVSVVVWASGTAFLQKVRDSLFFHGVLSSAVIPLVLMHASASGTNIPFDWSRLLLLASAGAVVAGAAPHIRRAISTAPR